MINNPPVDARNDAENLVRIVFTALSNIQSLLCGNLEFDEVYTEGFGYSDIYVWVNNQSTVTSNDNYNKAVDEMAERIENLYRFVKSPINDSGLMLEAKKSLTVLSTILQVDLLQLGQRSSFNLDRFDSNLDYGFTELFDAIKYGQAKINIIQQGKVNVSDIATLADITPMGVIQAIKRGNLVAEKHGNTWAIDSKSALEWLASR